MATKKRKISAVRVFFTVLIITFLVIAILSVTVLFPIKSISVSGESQYSHEEIVNASGLVVGNNILVVSEKGVSKTLSKQLPYIKSANLKRTLSGNITVTVSPEEKGYCCEYKDSFVVISKSLKVLELKAKRDKNAARILGIDSFTFEAGEPFIINDETKNRCFITLADLADKYDIKLTVIDLNNISDITVKIDNRLIVKFGTTVDIENKFAHLNEMLKSINDSAEGVIDLKTWSIDKAEGYFRKGDISNYFK